MPLPALTSAPDFEQEVAPILEARCMSCHEASQAKGDLRLDTRAHSFSVIVPGKPDASELLVQVSGEEPEMPKKAAPLSPAQVEILRRWIMKGGTFGQSDDWGFRPQDAARATSVYDLHATLLHLLGIDHQRLTVRHNSIDRRLTDVHGHVIKDMLA